MAHTNPNTIFCHLTKCYHNMVVITSFFIHLVCFSITAETTDNYSGGFSAHLIRKNSPDSPLSNHKRNKVFRHLTGPETPQSLLEIDPDAFEFLMKLSIGTPPSDIYVIADTGSRIIWTQCQPCKSCFKTKYNIFDPKRSSSYKNITCSDSECKHVDNFSPQNYCKNHPHAVCMYEIGYADESYSVGEVAKEVITMKFTSGKVVTLKDIVIGCGQNNNERDRTENEMGIVGLSRSPISFISQISPYVGGKKFSYCLVPVDSNPKIKSSIYFGNGSEVLGEGVVSTALADKDKYYVTVKGITIGSDFVPFNSTEELEEGNMLIDSGTSLIYFHPNFYERVMNQLVNKFDRKLERFNYIDKDNSSSLCFHTKKIPKAPDMTLHFDDGGKLQIMTDYIYKDDDKDFVCFGIMNSTSKGFDSENIGVIGNNLQANILIGFDLDKNLVSFKPTTCIKMSNFGGSNIVTHPFPIFYTFLLYLLFIISLSF